MLNALAGEGEMVTDQFKGSSPSRGWSGAPNYEQLRQGLVAATSPPSTRPLFQKRDPGSAADAPPPLRTANSSWYTTTYSAEAISELTFIREDINGPLPGGEVSTLDSMFVATGGTAGENKVIMTYYHGLDFPAAGSDRAYLVFSGFPLWHFRRAQQIVLADFVLQNIFGHVRALVSRDPQPATARASAAALRMTPPPAKPGRDNRLNRE
jgi:hypothetical protein